MTKLIDLTGQKFGRLTVLRMADSKLSSDGKYKSQCLCKCDCGNEIVVSSNALKRGTTKSCGCLAKEKRKQFKDLSGEKFGRLTVKNFLYEEYNEKQKSYTRYYNCICDCGNNVIKNDRYLKYTNVPSCGCYAKEINSQIAKMNNTKHGMKNSKIYHIWQSMKGRCKYRYVHGYENYGGRGIKVCDEWNNSFENFYEWAKNNGYKEGLSIDRIDVNGNYEPNNCRWVTLQQQANNRRTNKMITYNNKTQSVADWCRELDLNYNLINKRFLCTNWSVEKIFTEPRQEEMIRNKDGVNKYRKQGK